MPVVLLVEDSEDDAFFFRRTIRLSGASCKVHHAANGSLAKAFLLEMADSEAGLPAMIFLDLKMPVMNGFELLEWIETQAWAGEVPVAVLSGSEREDDRARARGLGALDYLVKPLRTAEVERVFKELVEGRKDGAREGASA